MKSGSGRVHSRYLRLFRMTVCEKMNVRIHREWFSARAWLLLEHADHEEFHFDLVDLIDIIVIVTERTGNRRIPFEFGLQMTLNRHSFLGYAMASARTIRDSIAIEEKYLNTLVPSVRCNLEESGNIFRFNFYYDLEPTIVPYAMEIGLAAATAASVEVIPVRLLRYFFANFNYSAPSYVDLYEEYLPFTLNFGQMINGFSSNRSVLDIGNPNFDAAINTLSIEQLDILSTRERRILDTLKKFIRRNLDSSPTLEEAAYHLHMSSRTMKRRLAEYGLTFSDLLAETRFDMATDLLQTSRFSVEEIAKRLGYAHSSSFSSAFKKYFGLTPSVWLERQQAKQHHVRYS